MRTIDINAIDMSKPRVRYNGKAQDKCGLSGIIHDVAFMAGNNAWPLYSDIYWDSARYDELKERLSHWICKYKTQKTNNNENQNND